MPSRASGDATLLGDKKKTSLMLLKFDGWQLRPQAASGSAAAKRGLRIL